uniref:Uncharacterized protein n=1 Tax=Arundo donax TaxID=35708 RepID=A0A0A9E5L2_ARUDO
MSNVMLQLKVFCTLIMEHHSVQWTNSTVGTILLQTASIMIQIIEASVLHSLIIIIMC